MWYELGCIVCGLAVAKCVHVVYNNYSQLQQYENIIGRLLYRVELLKHRVELLEHQLEPQKPPSTNEQLQSFSDWLRKKCNTWLAPDALTTIERLELDNMDLTSIPESIGALTTLKHLDLQGNRLTSIPDSIGQLTNLETLLLNQNKLTGLPRSLLNLKNLQKCNILYNKFVPENVPEEITTDDRFVKPPFFGNHIPQARPK